MSNCRMLLNLETNQSFKTEQTQAFMQKTAKPEIEGLSLVLCFVRKQTTVSHSFKANVHMKVCFTITDLCE